ncbi:MOSC domain-containing protein [Aureliella helgolandensis]|uniref:6-N-hydroxylaminopurine resistance protein n=1 Tax=Aureliella helgolandensis TaxID=2527968 RepID=A0A518GA75_9BACT|nr:MOSC domain-containing protein [Aureliella helgolandensis]QDV25473.1 6-N-hydroxylaminopurine resistance protein [Aureliella helgolandensis]
MKLIGRVASIQVGKSRQFPGASQEPSIENTDRPTRTTGAKPWTSAIIKEPVEGAIYVGLQNLVGDEQADLVHHGGIDKAVLGYASTHYEQWQADLPEFNFAPGSFGENLTLDGLEESTCCIGDQYSIGECVLEVSQPRQPCWKLTRRWGIPRLAIQVQRTGRTGWYFRVLQVGNIRSGQSIELIHRPFPQWTIAAASNVMYAKPRNPADDLALANCDALSASWSKTLRDRVRLNTDTDQTPRLFGSDSNAAD